MGKKFLALVLIALQLGIPFKALAALSEPDFATLNGFKNYAVNGGAEQNKAGWAVSGTSAALSDLVVDTTNKYEGNAGFTWTPANADNFLTNAALSITANQGLSGLNCAATLYTKTAATTHVLEAYDGTLVLNSVTIPASTSFVPITINWPCSSSGSNRVRFNAGATTAISFDSLKWGDARGINVSVAPNITAWQSYTPTGAWNTNTTYTGFWRQVGDSMHIIAHAALSGAPNSANFTLAIPSGYTIDAAKLPAANSPSLGSANLADVGTRGYVSSVYYNTTTTISLNHTETGNSGTVNETNPFTFGSGDRVDLEFTVPIVGFYASNVINLGRQTLPTDQKFLTGSGTYTTPPGVSYLHVRMIGGGGGGAASSTASNGQAGGIGGTTTFGTLSAPGGSGGPGGGMSPGGLGGTGGTASGPLVNAFDGGAGGAGKQELLVDYVIGGHGGAGMFGGGASAGVGNTAAPAAAATYGAGGGGGGNGSNGISGPGGGAGKGIDAIIPNPAVSYSYGVGAGGVGGTTGTGAFAGSAGHDGYIEVTEFYGAYGGILVAGLGDRQVVVGTPSTVAGSVTNASFTVLSNTPTVTIVPTKTKQFRVFTTFPVHSGTVNATCDYTINNSVGSGTLVYKGDNSMTQTSTPGNYYPSSIFAIYTLTVGVTYTFNVHAKCDSSATANAVFSRPTAGTSLIVEEFN